MKNNVTYVICYVICYNLTVPNTYITCYYNLNVRVDCLLKTCGNLHIKNLWRLVIEQRKFMEKSTSIWESRFLGGWMNVAGMWAHGVRNGVSRIFKGIMKGDLWEYGAVHKMVVIWEWQLCFSSLVWICSLQNLGFMWWAIHSFFLFTAFFISSFWIRINYKFNQTITESFYQPVINYY